MRAAIQETRYDVPLGFTLSALLVLEAAVAIAAYSAWHNREAILASIAKAAFGLMAMAGIWLGVCFVLIGGAR